jgi:hypothetical protein
MDATLKYHGDIRIVVAAGIGLKALSINLPIAIQNFVLEVVLIFCVCFVVVFILLYDRVV